MTGPGAMSPRDTMTPQAAHLTPTPFKAKMIRLGEFFFRNRSWTPIPWLVFLALCTFKHAPDLITWVPGLLFLVLGEWLRLWAVAVVGKGSRTRGGGVERLVTHGPYAYVRNPLYLGNFLLTMGVVFMSELLWMVPVAIGLFTIQYLSIILWEEQILTERFGSAYPAYCQRVPRWIPRWRRSSHEPTHIAYQWRAAWWSERSTLGAIAALLIVMLVKENLAHLPKYLRKHFAVSGSQRLP